MHIVFLVSYGFFVFYYWRRRDFCPGASIAALQEEVPGVIHLGIPQDARKVDGMVGTHIVTKMINVQYAPLTKQ